MKRAHPVEIRKSLEAARALAKEGILFIPMPVVSVDDQVALAHQMIERLEQLTLQAEASERKA